MAIHEKNEHILLYTERSMGRETQRVCKYAWPGGYPMFYVTKSGDVLSAEAVEDNMDDCIDPDSDWFVVAHDVNWEDPDLFCSEGGGRIESAYAEEEEEEEEEAAA